MPSVSARAQAAINAQTSSKIAAILPILNAYPVGTVPSANSNLDIAVLSAASSVDEYYGSFRFDYTANEKNTFVLRGYRDQGDEIDPASVTGNGTYFTNVPQNYMFAWTRVFSPSVVNEIKFGLNADKTRSFGTVKPAAGVDLSSILVNFTGSVAVPGIASQGASAGAAILGGLIRANSAYNTRGPTLYELRVAAHRHVECDPRRT